MILFYDKKHVMFVLIYSNAESMLNNFSRIEAPLQLLKIRFDVNKARDLMKQKPGAATKFCYELFVALNRKQQSGLTSVAMETMRPAAPARLDAINNQIYKDVSNVSVRYQWFGHNYTLKALLNKLLLRATNMFHKNIVYSINT